MNTILIVDDEKEIADVVELYLQNEYHVLKFYTGQDALDCIESTRIDLAILDVMLPDIDGFTILKKIREKRLWYQTLWVRIIFLLRNYQESRAVPKIKKL